MGEGWAYSGCAWLIQIKVVGKVWYEQDEDEMMGMSRIMGPSRTKVSRAGGHRAFLPEKQSVGVEGMGYEG